MNAPDLADVSPMGGAYLTVIDRARTAIGHHLDAPAPGAPTSVRKAGTAWRNATGILDTIPGILAELPARLAPIAGDNDLTVDAKDARLTVAAAEAQTRVDRLASDVRDKLAGIVDTLARDALPARPGDTAADEGRLANAKADMRMVLDAMPAGDPTRIAERIGDLLARALRDGDQHTAYLLGATHWPADYVATRDPRAAKHLQEIVTARVNEALDQADGGAFTAARRVHRTLTGANGTNAINVALNQLPALVGHLREWTVSRTPVGARPRAVPRW